MCGHDDMDGVARELRGRMIVDVTYVGMASTGSRHFPVEPTDVVWDFDGWHWAEIAVEFTIEDAAIFHATWDDQQIQFDLSIGRGPSRWPVERSYRWSVTRHPRWMPLIRSPILSVDFTFGSPDPSCTVHAPVAVRLTTRAGAAWIVTADPDLGDVGQDDLVVVFDDQSMTRLGLQKPNEASWVHPIT